MHFVDRKAKYPGRWTMTKSDGTSEIITLIRNDEPVVDGTPMNADTLNTLSDVAGADIAREKAEAAAEEAKKSADKAAAVVSTDPTLTVSGAPADAAAVGGIVLPRVVVHTEAGSSIVLSDGEKSVSGVAAGGSFSAALPHDGEWTVTATLGSGAATETVQAEYCRTKTLTLGDKTTEDSVEVTEYKDYPLELAYAKIYGVCWNYGNSSTTCTRLTKASDPNGFVNVDITTEPKAAVGAGAGRSPFDACMPWSGMEEYNVTSGKVGPKFGESGFSRSNADVMVFIPEFYYRVIDDASGKKRYFYVADKKISDFEKHPGSGRYVGRYNTGSGHVSRTGMSPLVSITRASARSGAKSKGSGWYGYDYASWCAVGLLYIVEYADWNTQSKIGKGYSSGSSVISSGGTDVMTYHTGRVYGTDGATAVQYRHIENPWGNVSEWVDGVNFNARTVYVCTDPAKYADDTSDGYTNAGTRASSSGYISALGASTTAPWAIYPSSPGGSETTYIPDYSWTSSGWRVLFVGGSWSSGSKAGLFWFNGYNSSSSSDSYVGARLLFVP